jgi:hypothetical protein
MAAMMTRLGPLRILLENDAPQYHDQLVRDLGRQPTRVTSQIYKLFRNHGMPDVEALQQEMAEKMARKPNYFCHGVAKKPYSAELAAWLTIHNTMQRAFGSVSIIGLDVFFFVK